MESRRTPRRPDWKARLKQACLERMQRQREEILWQARSPDSSQKHQRNAQVVESTIKSILSNELEAVDKDEMIWDYSEPKKLSEHEYEELMLAMQTLLYDTPTTGIDDYENAESLQNSSAAYLLEQQENGVLCPICKQAYLHETKKSVICSKGCLELEIQYDKVGLEYLRGRFAELFQEHFDTGCRSPATFTFHQKFQSLYMICSSCDYFEMI